jgi:DNA-binding transcriptional ArsR family regulator
MSRAEPRAAPRDPAPVFAALGDRTRLTLLGRLSDGRARSIASLSADTRLTRQAITKHLHVLEQAGLVGSARVGRESRYTFQPAAVLEARAYLDRVAAQWDDALGRLKRFIED